eukprot:2473871-Rhodomonas_salina.3
MDPAPPPAAASPSEKKALGSGEVDEGCAAVCSGVIWCQPHPPAVSSTPPGIASHRQRRPEPLQNRCRTRHAVACMRSRSAGWTGGRGGRGPGSWTRQPAGAGAALPAHAPPFVRG